MRDPPQTGMAPVTPTATPTTETASKSPFLRLSRKTSTAVSSTSTPVAQVAAPLTVAVGSTLGTLETLPTALLDRVLQACAPELAKVRNVSRGCRAAVDRYVGKKCKRFQESVEEAECWGHRAPTLSDLLFLDPLALRNILQKYYAPRLYGTGTSLKIQGTNGAAGNALRIESSEVGGISELGDEDDDDESDELTNDLNRGGDTALESVGDDDVKRGVNATSGGTLARTGTVVKREAAMQKLLFTAFRAALDNYEEGCWATVGVLREFVVKNRLQYSLAATAGSSMGTPSSPNNDVTALGTRLDIPDDVHSERDMADGASVRSGCTERRNKTDGGLGLGADGQSLDNLLNLPTRLLPTLPASTAKDSIWLRLNGELYRQACMHGHAFNLPPLSDLGGMEESSINGGGVVGTLTASAEIAVRADQPGMLVACLDSSRIVGCLWAVIDRGFQAVMAADRVGRRVGVDSVLVLLDAAFNDPLGPWAGCLASRKWGFDGWQRGRSYGAAQDGEVLAADTARGLLIKAEECTKLYGLPWHRLSVRGEFAVVPVEEVAREVRSRLKIMM
ncbi:uncharacterized protein EV422DRAFT_618355 [Fimicolochytrium jonesii]|uniref:uncharacterized protein n=1 Tax=Fimicolochytrium jonesii TaxID=1396493 RepID=UPI0022FE2828|nr:uncharacterized protein EV422DRAFT_618355 [Fimicolochytrium jonesii]KAI8823488.1 hypothetical protein EV422DRAFT_618355 [Fimicolochytrium jonesii]